MQWDPTLADLAELNTRQCAFKHDCKNMIQFNYIGQNLMRLTTTAEYFDIPGVIEWAIRDWTKEREYTRLSDKVNEIRLYELQNF